MEPLFKNQEEYDTFQNRHAAHKVETRSLAEYRGNCYLGIDAGSTTTKVALVGEDGSLYTLSIAVTTALRLQQQSVPSVKFMTGFHRAQRLSTPAQQDTAKH
ncbi:MAG: hypothetical protein ACLTH3_00460 [Lachnospira sp.]